MLPANTEFIGGWCKFTVRKKIALSKIQNVYSACYNVSLIRKRAISLQKVHLWMEISAACSNRGRRSLTKMDRLRNVHPEQRVDAATDIARICASRFSTKTLRYLIGGLWKSASIPQNTQTCYVTKTLYFFHFIIHSANSRKSTNTDNCCFNWRYSGTNRSISA